MRVRVHQMLVALPLTLVTALGIAVAVQSFSLESADLLSIAPADAPLPLDAVRGSIEGIVPPPPARPVEPTQALAAPAPAPATAPTVRGITGFTAPDGGANAVSAPAPKAKAPAAHPQRPKSATAPRSVPRNPDCVPSDPTIRSLPNPHGTRHAVPRERAVSGPNPGTPLLPGSVPARNSAGLPGSGSPVSGLINRPSTSRPGPSISGPGPSYPSYPQPGTSLPQSGHADSEPAQDPFADAEQVGVSEPSQDDGVQTTPQADADQVGFSPRTAAPATSSQGAPSRAALSRRTPRGDGDQVGTPGQTPNQVSTPGQSPQIGAGPVDAPGQAPRVTGCGGPDRGAPGHSPRRRVPATEPVISRDGGLATPARSGW